MSNERLTVVGGGLVGSAIAYGARAGEYRSVCWTRGIRRSGPPVAISG